MFALVVFGGLWVILVMCFFVLENFNHGDTWPGHEPSLFQISMYTEVFWYVMGRHKTQKYKILLGMVRMSSILFLLAILRYWFMPPI